MGSIRQYLVTLIAAAILCSIAINFIGNKGMLSAVTKLVTGLFIMICALSPAIKIEFEDISAYFASLNAEAESFSDQGQAYYKESASAVIKSQLESYIVDKATVMNADIKAEVSMSCDDPFVPHSVRITGTVAPYTKQRIEQEISNALGIPKENQKWT